MIWKSDKHLFTATVCQKTGKPCPALAQMGKKLAQAISAAKPLTADDFEIDGSCALEHCATGCDARFRADHSRIRVFCGVNDEADSERLNQIEDALLNSSRTVFPSGWIKQMPCAFLEAVPQGNQAAETACHAPL